MVDKNFSAGKRMRLRYADTCRECGASVAAGQQAVYFRDRKVVSCLICWDPDAPTDSEISAETVEAPLVEVGVPGASARREYQRRLAKREERIRAAHPRLGSLILAVSDEPQSTRAWIRGAGGEELLAEWLDPLAAHGVLLLHDRQIPGSKANIDHIAISSAGVFVVDAKRYAGRPHLKVEGGILRPRTESLMVGRRDCTKLLAGLSKQVDWVRSALEGRFAAVPVRGVMCFVEADWPLIGGSFSTNGVDVLWPKRAAAVISADGSCDDDVLSEIHRRLATRFPVA
jgi:hypothetical protein